MQKWKSKMNKLENVYQHQTSQGINTSILHQNNHHCIQNIDVKDFCNNYPALIGLSP